MVYARCNRPCVPCIIPFMNINRFSERKGYPFHLQQLASVSIESPASIERAADYSIVFHSPQPASDHYTGKIFLAAIYGKIVVLPLRIWTIAVSDLPCCDFDCKNQHRSEHYISGDEEHLHGLQNWVGVIVNMTCRLDCY